MELCFLNPESNRRSLCLTLKKPSINAFAMNASLIQTVMFCIVPEELPKNQWNKCEHLDAVACSVQSTMNASFQDAISA
jgi:hypothetical protein